MVPSIQESVQALKSIKQKNLKLHVTQALPASINHLEKYSDAAAATAGIDKSNIKQPRAECNNSNEKARSGSRSRNYGCKQP